MQSVMGLPAPLINVMTTSSLHRRVRIPPPTGWVRMSRNHVFCSGPKYTILSLTGRGMSLV